MNYLMKEIKNRGNFTVLSAIILTIVTFNYKEIALYLIIKPCLASLKYNHMYFIYTNLTEILSNYVTISIVICLVNFCILITYNFIEFIIPGLYKKEIFILKKIFSYSFRFLKLSVYIFYTYTIPITWDFFLNFQKPTLGFKFYLETRLSDYLNFFFDILSLTVVVGQLCLFLFLLLDSKINNKNRFKVLRKKNYMALLLFSTLITPPDLFSQIFVYILNIILYECVIYFILIKRKGLWKPIKAH